MHRAVLRRLIFVASIFTFVFAYVASASAQSITLATGLYRKQPVRSASSLPYWVSRSDCLAEDVISFYPVALTDYTGDTLQVWGGARGIDCSTPTNRAANGSACFLLYNQPAAAAATRVDVPVVALVAHSSAKVARDSHGYPAVCTSSTAAASDPLTLYFDLVDGTATVVASAAWNDTGVDVVPPEPPASVTASRGDTRILLDWTATSESDVRSYRFYCDPAPGTLYADGGVISGSLPSASNDVGATSSAVESDADVSAEGSTDGGTPAVDAGAGGASAETIADAGTSAGATCSTTSILTPGTDAQYPAPLDRYFCGSATSGVTSATVKNLVDYVDYVITVSAVDQVGNIGTLSNQICEVPAQITDFFGLYRQAGGKAGGGICSLSRPPPPSHGDGYAVMAAVVATGATRMRRRARISQRWQAESAAS
ncbi:MAG TPA: hypothetical protein VH062_35895 [Polyangiaceae bacterium]|jgi:hypothetical protein|nr:hypothetical protein [Polyangiaceae bacterium]